MNCFKKSKKVNLKVVFDWFVFIVLISGLSISLLADGDIFCNCTNKTHETPGACLRDCKGNVTKCTGCFLKPRCPAMDIDAFKKMYNMWMLGHGRLLPLTRAGYPPDPGLLTVASKIISLFFKPFKSTDFHIILHSETGKGWAQLDPPEEPGKKPFLYIQRDLFLMSPAFLVSAIGHEMVHWVQFQRGIKNLYGLETATLGFLELEASYWEIGMSDFQWPIGPNKLFNCYTQAEHDAAMKLIECRRWQIRFGIGEADLATLNIRHLEEWLNENPWTRQIWLPENPKWKKYDAEPPSPCQ